MQRGGYKLLPCGIAFRTGRKLASVRTSLQGSSLVLYCSQGWIERKNGRDIIGNETKYTEEIIGDNLVITIKNPSTDWHEWIKTLGEVSFEYDVEQISNGFRITVPKQYDKSSECKLFKQVFHKAAYCVNSKRTGTIQIA